MANNKGKRTDPTRQGTPRGTVAAGGPTARPAPASPGGPNRLQRKEEARRQREAIERRAGRRRALRRGGWVTAGIAVAVAIVLVFVNSGATAGLSNDEKKLLADAPAAAQAAGCTAVQTIKAYSPASLDRAHIGTSSGPASMPALSTYPSQPPTSGPHNPTPLSAGVYQDPPPIDQSLHSLEHAAAIVWYAPSAGTSSELVKTQQFFADAAHRDHVIVAPYNYPQAGGQLPAGKQMVLVAWHHMQTCSSPSLAVAFQFIHAYRVVTACDTSSYKGDAPEQCVQI